MSVSMRGCPLLESRSPVVSITNQFRIELRSTNGSNLIDRGADAIETLVRASTGSGTFVYRVRTIDKEYVVFKVAVKRRGTTYADKDRKIQNGLKH